MQLLYKIFAVVDKFPFFLFDLKITYVIEVIIKMGYSSALFITGKYFPSKKYVPNTLKNSSEEYASNKCHAQL